MYGSILFGSKKNHSLFEKWNRLNASNKPIKLSSHIKNLFGNYFANNGKYINTKKFLLKVCSPDFNLSFVQTQQGCNFQSSRPGQVFVCVKLFLQFGQLFRCKVGPGRYKRGTYKKTQQIFMFQYYDNFLCFSIMIKHTVWNPLPELNPTWQTPKSSKALAIAAAETSQTADGMLLKVSIVRGGKEAG